MNPLTALEWHVSKISYVIASDGKSNMPMELELCLLHACFKYSNALYLHDVGVQKLTIKLQ